MKRHKFKYKRLPPDAQWRVDLNFPLADSFTGFDRKVIFPAAAGILGGRGFSDYSGGGFGGRDHGWYVHDRVTAMQLARALKKAMSTVQDPKRITVQAPPKVVLDTPTPRARKKS